MYTLLVKIVPKRIKKTVINEGLKYFTLHVMSLYNILVSPFKVELLK